ncbi:DUF3500 domain-containing protein [Maribacter sp. 2304DJ31-5]|uniref:DUF3500 domain-containing protein n=1 Tax=Maribacter sp. 2304DJ31-5 TaxID=3386273 RepID=UPI0039BCC233
MKKIILITFVIAIAIFLSFSFYQKAPIINFLNSLNQDQRDKTLFPFDDGSKTTWHFIPGSMFSRAGIQLSELNPTQKELLNKLLRSFLSETGYHKTRKIMDLERVLLEITGDTLMRDPEKYSVAVYGNPEKDSLWAWSFEGHHLSLNFTVHHGKALIAPRFLGANPATILSGKRKGEQTLDKEENLGFKLIRSLSDEQKTIAIFQQKALPEIVTFNSATVEPLDPTGITFKEMNPSQQAIFLEIVDEYLSTIPYKQAKRKMERIKKEETDVLRFGWAGAISPGKGHYYRIQGKSFLIEFDNTQNNANHIHTVWRDFNGDFGRNLIREHYSNSHHHKN